MASRFTQLQEQARNGTNSPVPRSGVIPGREDAHQLKFKHGSVSSTSKKLPGITPVPVYTSNPPAYRTTYPPAQYVPEQVSSFGGGLDDSTVASDFDETITSDLAVPHHFAEDDETQPFEDEEPYASQQAEYQSYSQSQHPRLSVQHRLQHKQSQSPMIEQNAEQELLRISGQFGGQKHGNLVVRSLEDPTPSRAKRQSRKRSRSGDHNAQPSIIVEERSSQMDDVEEIMPQLPESEVLSENDESEEEDAPTPNPSPSKNRRKKEPLISQQTPRPVKPTEAPKKDPIVPDYTDAQLRKMTYAELENESWEKIDDKKTFQLAKPLRDTSALEEKMEHYAFKEGQDAQVAFYGQLSHSDWENGGDWFVERFTDLMNELKKKRIEKKAITQKYEAELSAREKSVRGKSDNLDREFKDMRVGGEGILKGKRV
ncbi:uncharacterized protein LY89DRAFT_689630 [Mollisia scopiformis]|uniref:Extracellular mutant protein 11 C-terminal domain-containing protein n=1 Tax=Mollisia scopiformis TaxID=149040 RepID=A0A132BD78_MOLSC|nr:uncharacterized protein LY89DRAFT_689630 [Mollisia scopiformis]KUJ10356.1 hypothetical protein LY89DRAFT_689630 [Mollisia scopiformis]